MRRAIATILLMASASAWCQMIMGPPTLWSVYRRGSVTPPGPYAWDTAYTNSVLLWEFANTNNPTADTSYIGTNSGTLGATTAKPAWVAATGGVSAVYSFDGGDVITAQKCPVFTNRSNFLTAMGWFRVSATNKTHVLAVKGTISPANNREFQIIVRQTNQLCGFVFDADNDYLGRSVGGRGSLYPGVWYHCSMTFTGGSAATAIKLHLDGVQVDNQSENSGAFNGKRKSASDITLGYRSDGASLTGSADEFKIYFPSITAAEVATNFWMTATNHGWTKWDFDNRTGLYLNQALACSFNYAAAADQSTNRNHGTVSGATWIAPDNNGCYSFDGAGDTIAYGDINAMDGKSNMTISAWFYNLTGGSTGFRGILVKDNTTTTDGTNRVWMSRGGTSFGGITNIFVAVNGPGKTGYGFTTGAGNLTLNTWRHVAVVFDGSQATDANKVKVYIDGVQKTLTIANSFPTKTAVNSYALTAGIANNSLMVAYLDGLRVFAGNGSQYSLTSNQVYQLSRQRQ